MVVARRRRSRSTSRSHSASGSPSSVPPPPPRLPWRDRESEEAFRRMNEMYTTDVHLAFLFKPRSITVLLLGFIALVWVSSTGAAGPAMPPSTAAGHSGYDSGYDSGYAWVRALCGACLSLLTFSAVALPNGPFVRPHPVVWRVVLGMTVLYLMALVAMVSVPPDEAARGLRWLVGARVARRPGDEATSCDVTAANLWSRVDVFVAAHFGGWVVKALLLRDPFLCLVTSCAWELSELVMKRLLPNFNECWWDAVLFDILGANLLGIVVGTKLCAWLEMRKYRWVPFNRIASGPGKVLRVVQQFTPASWTPSAWDVGPRSFAQMVGVCLALQANELAAFFLKHNFALATKHWVNLARLALWSLAGSPALRQIYVYVTDPRCKRLGTQAWVCAACMAAEALLVVRSSGGLYGGADPAIVIAIWVISQLAFLSAAVAARSVLFRAFPGLGPRPLAPGSKGPQKR